MENLVFGIFAIVGGAVFCFRGALAFRVLIPVWGAFVGFAAGAGFIASMTGGGFLQTGLAWIVGLVTAAIFFVIAYLYYSVAVVLAMGSIGFALGTSLMVALNIPWNWIIVLAGVVLGVALAIWAFMANLPLMLLVVLGAVGGASAIVTGFMLLVGVVNAADFSNPDVTIAVNDQWWWYVLYMVLVVLGILAQVRSIGQMRLRMEDVWIGGRRP